MMNLLVYSLVKEMYTKDNLVDKLRTVLILCKMFGIRINEEQANELLAKLPFALKLVEEYRSSRFTFDVSEDVIEIIKASEALYRDLVTKLYIHTKSVMNASGLPI